MFVKVANMMALASFVGPSHAAVPCAGSAQANERREIVVMHAARAKRMNMLVASSRPPHCETRATSGAREITGELRMREGGIRRRGGGCRIFGGSSGRNLGGPDATLREFL
jgi:hypothetical protein